MPRLVHARPKYRQHRASKQAIVEIAGRVHYLGPYGSPESHGQYDRLVSAWMAQGRPQEFTPECSDLPVVVQAPLSDLPAPTSSSVDPPPSVPCSTAKAELTIVQLIARFWRHAKKRYVSFGRRTGTHENYRPVLKLLRRRYGKQLVASFGPIALQALRDEMIRKGNSRRYINDNVDRIRKVFTWGVSQEIVPRDLPTALSTVECLWQGCDGAAESEPVEPVSDQVVRQTLRYLPAVVAAMVRVQLLTGSRPGEICIMRPADIDRSEKLWLYTPKFHKTQRHGKKRFIVLGPRAQKILAPYLDRDPETYCFCPAESQAQLNTLRRRNRRTPMTPSQAARQHKPDGRRRPGDLYTNDAYRRAITRGCDKAFSPPLEMVGEERKRWISEHRWSPNQLRHSAATKICNQFESLLAAKETLGHSTIRVTEGYAKPSLKFAKRAMRKLG